MSDDFNDSVDGDQDLNDDRDDDNDEDPASANPDDDNKDSDDDSNDDVDQSSSSVSSGSDDDDDVDSQGNEENEKEREDTMIQVMNQDEQPIEVKQKKRIFPPFLTQYQKARVIGTRALQISKNSPIYVDVGTDQYDPIKIAEQEFQEKKIPFIIRRFYPDGKHYEDWPLHQLHVYA